MDGGRMPVPLRLPPEGVAVRLRGVARSFGAQPVLHGLDLDIEPGSFVAIVGRSGCGKSTLLRIVTGLDPADAGEVLFDDAPPRAGAARLMFQEPRLLPWARVQQNVEIGLGARDRDTAARAQARDVLGKVGLLSRADDWPAALSGGQKQRVALARALASEPRLLALDEPLGALDALTRIEMQRLLERVWLEQGFTALLVTHDVAEAVALADRVVLLEAGRIGLDLRIDLARPRRRGTPEAASLEAHLLAHLLRDEETLS